MTAEECIRWKMKSSALTLLQPEFKKLFQDSVIQHTIAASNSNFLVPNQNIASEKQKSGSARSEQLALSDTIDIQKKTVQTENQLKNDSDHLQLPQRLNWHLRKKRADLFIDMQSAAPFLADLKKFLQSKGISVLPYDQNMHYLPYDLLLCDSTRAPLEGKYCCLNGEKRSVWEFLKKNFKGKF